MSQNLKIRKKRNFEGYYFTCQCCGREIKHAYYIEGQKGVYGSECINKIAGHITKKDIETAKSIYKVAEKFYNNPKQYRIPEEKLDVFIEKYLETGNENIARAIIYS